MHVKYKKVLWEAYRKINHELSMYDRSSHRYRALVWEYNPYVKSITIDDARVLIQELNYLSNLNRQVVNDDIGKLTKPDNFNLTMKYMKNILKFKNETNINILNMYVGKDKVKIKRQLSTEINGLEYYIEKLQDQEFIDTLPEEILTFSQKYN